ncbi:hypothetical protein EDC04DRAFT_2887646 [Pisolithus marmoratus]|nr:hypothetical protein EDC04DRAFT_2887646 [Pisolithus marmoratus]
MSTNPELQALFTVLYQIRVVNYVTVSCAACLVYDVLTNLDKEVHFIWRYYRNMDDAHISWRRRLRRMLVQALFIFGRYYAILYLIGYFAAMAYLFPYMHPYGSVWQILTVSSDSCKGFYYHSALAGQILYTMLVNIILVMRLNVLYQVIHGIEGLPKYQSFLATVVILEFMAEMSISILAARWIRGRVVEPTPRDSLARMLPQPKSKRIIAILIASWFCFYPGLVEDLMPYFSDSFRTHLHLLFSSMRWRLRRFKDFTISNIKEEIRSIQPTTLMLIKDGVLFYIPMVVMLVASVVVMSRVHHSFFTDITVPFLMALYSFCSARFIIHTRETIGQPTSIQQVEEMTLSTLSRHR